MINFASRENPDDDHEGVTIPKRVVTDASDLTEEEVGRIHKRVLATPDAERTPTALRKIIALECKALLAGDDWNAFLRDFVQRVEKMGLPF